MRVMFYIDKYLKEIKIILNWKNITHTNIDAITIIYNYDLLRFNKLSLIIQT